MRLEITSVTVEAVRGPHPGFPDGDRQRQVRPLSIYAAHRPTRLQPPARPPQHLESLYLYIATDGGPIGCYGPIDDEAAWPIVDELAGFLIGEDALAVTTVWDKLARLDRHSRHGQYKIAMSAVDNALWDLRGKAFDAPVWQLLGGSGRDVIPAYASTLGTPLDASVVDTVARELKDAGFWGQKWFFADGPGDGDEGLARNVDLARQLRASLGDTYSIMFDAFHGWDLGYARAWVDRVRDLRPTWLEEPLPPDHYPAFVELHRSTGQALSTGEHLYDRAEVLPYLDDGAISVLQCDPEWCGGVTELVRMCAVAEPFGVAVIPHGHGLHSALHVVASQSPGVCPSVEYLIRIMPNRHHFEVDPPAPVDGSIALPDEPGFGITIDDTKITSRETLTRRR